METNQLYKEILKFLEVGDKIYIKGEKRGFEIKARNERYLICTKPFNPKKTVTYTILDSEELINSTNNFVFNIYDYSIQKDVEESLVDLIEGKYELSQRRQVNTVNLIDRFKKRGDKKIIEFTQAGAQVLCISDTLVKRTLEEAYDEFKSKIDGASNVNMKAKCISDCCGDFWDITVGKEYEVVEHIPEYLMYITNGKKVTEERYRIKDDSESLYPYPISCFEIVS